MPNFAVRTLEGQNSEHDYLIEIMDGEFAGLFIHFGKIQILDEEDEEGYGQIQFEYDVAIKPDEFVVEDNVEKLNALAGAVLQEIITDIANREKESEDRNVDSEQPGS